MESKVKILLNWVYVYDMDSESPDLEGVERKQGRK